MLHLYRSALAKLKPTSHIANIQKAWHYTAAPGHETRTYNIDAFTAEYLKKMNSAAPKPHVLSPWAQGYLDEVQRVTDFLATGKGDYRWVPIPRKELESWEKLLLEDDEERAQQSLAPRLPRP